MQNIRKKTKRSIQWVQPPHVSNTRAAAKSKELPLFLTPPSGVVGEDEDLSSSTISKYVGIHLFAEFWFCRIIEDPKKIKKILITAAKKSKNTPLKIIIHKFSPQGITGVVLLQESHIALHSWPEKNYLAIDIFTCGEKTISHKAIAYLKKVFKPKRVEIQKIKRGLLKY